MLSDVVVCYNLGIRRKGIYMFRLDDKFLEDLGLGDLPPEQKQAFLQHIYSELEMRVGERLTDGMSDELLDEFGYFVDMNQDGMTTWFN